MGNMNVFDLLIVFSGLYLIYAAVVMKKDGEIKNGILVGKDVDVNRIRDKEGYIRYMFGKVLVIGVLAVVVGGIGMAGTEIGGGYLPLIGTGVYLIILIFFAAAAKKAKKEFIDE